MVSVRVRVRSAVVRKVGNPLVAEYFNSQLRQRQLKRISHEMPIAKNVQEKKSVVEVLSIAI